MRLVAGMVRHLGMPDTHSRRWVPVWMVVGALLFVLLCGRAEAGDTVIGFDDVPPDTPVATQDHARGVDFGMPPYSSLPPTSQIPSVLCCYPITRTAPIGHSSQVADLSWHSTEEWQAGMFGSCGRSQSGQIWSMQSSPNRSKLNESSRAQ